MKKRRAGAKRAASFKRFTRSGGKDKVAVARGHQGALYGRTPKKPEPDMRVNRTTPKLTTAKRRQLEKVNL